MSDWQLWGHSPFFPAEGKEFWGIILGLNESDRPKMCNGVPLYKVWIPQEYGKYIPEGGRPGVSPSDLPFITIIQQAGMESGTTSGGLMDVGQLVRVAKDAGQGMNGFGSIIGLLNPATSSDTGMKGATTSLIDRALEATKREVRLPPDLQTVLNDNGVEVTKLIEKGLFSLKNVFGIASHGTQIGGVQIPQITNILTAKGGAAGFITSVIGQSMPGTQFSLGNLLSIMPQALKDELFSVMPKEVSEALNTILAMTQNYDTSAVTGGLSMAKRIDPTIFLVHAVTLLKDIKDVDGLIAVLKTLMTDDSLGGISSAKQFYKSASTFGDKEISIDSLGNITSLLESAGQDKLRAFSSMVESITSPTGTLFDQVSDLPGMIDRLKPEVAQLMTGMINDISASSFSGAADFVKGGPA